MVRVSLSHAVDALIELGRSYLEGSEAANSVDILLLRCREMMSLMGEPSGTALAREIIDRYDSLRLEERNELLRRLAREFAPDMANVADAAQMFLEKPDENSYHNLRLAIEPLRQELFRRLNVAPGGTRAIVEMRSLLLRSLPHDPELRGLEFDLRHLLTSWFNRGFLQFERIDWRTSAIILEKLIEYEAVHEITGWKDLRRRLASDRRCFAFFHPALLDEPLIFVEVALTRGLAGRIEDLIHSPIDDEEKETPDTAIFYSISNCQDGLSGISFGNLLIKQVVDAIRSEVPAINRFATLSPIPGYRSWVEKLLNNGALSSLNEAEVQLLGEMERVQSCPVPDMLEQTLTNLCALYLKKARWGEAPLDPVARFHLGNGASIERIHWGADLSPKGARQSYGIMVNYLYDPGSIVANHEAYVRSGRVSASGQVSRQASRAPALETGLQAPPGSC